MGDTHDISKHVKIYLLVFLALLVGTVITVAMYYVHFESTAVAVAVALFIASIKAFLVAGFFMHLISEKTAVYAIMASTMFFFASMMALTLFSFSDVPTVSG